MKLVKFLFPIFILGCGIAFIFVFEFYIKDKVNTVPVLVATDTIPFKEAFTNENLSIKAVRRDDVVEGAYIRLTEQHLERIIGQVAAIDIPKGTQIYPALVDSHNLIPNTEAGEFIAPIPNQWIFAVPGSLRRSYYVDIYVISTAKEESIRQHIQPILSADPDQPSEPRVVTAQQDEWVREELFTKPVLSNIRIVHTKDSSNREVRTVQESEWDATGNISTIEIIATTEMLQLLQRYIQQGYKLYLTYTIRE